MGKATLSFRNTKAITVDLINNISMLVQGLEMANEILDTKTLEAELQVNKIAMDKLEIGTKNHSDIFKKNEAIQKKIDSLNNQKKIVRNYVNSQLNSKKVTKTSSAYTGLYEQLFGKLYDQYEASHNTKSWTKYDKGMRVFVDETFGFTGAKNSLVNKFGNSLARAAGVRVVSGKKCLEGEDVKPLSPNQWNRVVFRAMRDYMFDNEAGKAGLIQYLGEDYKLILEIKDSKVKKFEVVKKTEAEKKAEAESKTKAAEEKKAKAKAKAKATREAKKASKASK